VTDDAPRHDLHGTGTSAPVHRAPPKDERPRSRLAVWALVITIVLGLAAIMGYLWAALIPAAILGAIAVVRIDPHQAKGQGMAIVAICLSVLIGSCHFLVAKAARDTALYLGRGAMAALAAEDPTKIEQWIEREALAAGAAERIRQRYAAVVEALGPSEREVLEGSLWLGVLPFKLPPPGVEKLKQFGEGDGDGEKWEVDPDSFWVRARFARGVVHVELELADVYDGLVETAEKAQKTEPAAVLADIRFFLDDS
jgi:hypothetical protein